MPSEWDPSKVAWYAIHALDEAAREFAWPDDEWGNSCALLIEDIVEQGSVAVASADAGHWSAASSVERLLTERVELLMGVSVDVRYARRYSDSTGDTQPGSLRPKKRARADDSWDTMARALKIPPKELESLRTSLISMKDIQSDYYVHPTPLGPMTSRLIRSGEIRVDWHWDQILTVLAWACVQVVGLVNPRKLTIPADLVRAVDGCVKAMSTSRAEVAGMFAEMHAIIAERIVAVPSSERPHKADAER